MSKHSSNNEEQIAWDVGTVPPGPRNFPSTRLLRGRNDVSHAVYTDETETHESILRSSS